MNTPTFDPQELLNQARHQQQEDIIDVDEDTEQLVIISLGNDWFALNGRFVKEILPDIPITYVPGLPDIFLGLINVRGDLESVIDLAKIIQITSSRDDHLNRILILHHDDFSSGFRVDYVHDIIDLPKSRIASSLNVTDTKRGKYFLGEFEYKSKTVLILDPQRLLHTLLQEDPL
jgi:purine-binding chemotaxis protein CheW